MVQPGHLARHFAFVISSATALALAPTMAAEPGEPLTTRPVTRLVRYAGYEARVPANWPIHDLSADPTRCVRFDRHAVYLGRPGPDQDCPAHAVGRTETLLVEPVTDPGDRSAWAPAQPNTLRAAFGRAVVTATFGADEALARTFVRGGAVFPDGDAAEDARLEPEPAPRVAPEDRTARARGRGFDTCAAPSLRAMRAWRSSPYRSVGIYVGGPNRACGYGNLTPSWVRTVRRSGFTFIPIYVGLQAPCTTRSWGRIDPRRALQQGIAAANDAVPRLRSLGFGAGSPVYLDMEHYPVGGRCSGAVLSYVSGWVHRLHQLRYVGGFYSSGSSGIRDVARAVGRRGFIRPDAIWIARWDGRARVFGDRSVPDSYWANRQRLKQYAGGHRETHGGVMINVDSDYLDGPVG